MNVFWLAVPAICDLVTSTLQYIALNFIPGSVYQMMRGGAIVTTFIFSITFLKVKIERNMVIGSALALVGVTVVGASNMIFSGSGSGASDAVFIFLFRVFRYWDTYLSLFLSFLMASFLFLSRNYSQSTI